MIRLCQKTTQTVVAVGIMVVSLVTMSCSTGKYASGMYGDVSYQPAGGRMDPMDPNAQMVQGVPAAAGTLSPEQKLAQLSNYRNELQARIDALATELAGAKKKPGAQIVQQMEQLAMEIDRIDVELSAVAGVLANRRQELENIPVEKPEQPEKTEIVTTHSPENDQVVRADNRVIYSVQIGLLERPNVKAYGELPDVKQVKRGDGYAYYYGMYTSKAGADGAAKRLRNEAKYNDAFVVALKGEQRIPLAEAKRILGK